MIKSFADRRTAGLFAGVPLKGIGPDVAKRARVKLTQINAITSLEIMRSPPGNHLEALKGDRAGQHSIRVNDQFRICFRWDGQDAHDVEFVDYH